MTKYKICTYNIGHSFHFEKIKSRKNIKNNLNNQVLLLNNINADVYLLQEASKHLLTNKAINITKKIINNVNNNSNYYVSNTKIPLIDSGLLTISKYNSSNTKIIMPYKYHNIINNNTILNKAVIKTVTNDLIIYNIHLTPYSKNSELRIKQLKYIYDLATKELINNYIVIGGDFNISNNDMNIIKDFIDLNKWNIIFPNTKTHRNNNIYDGFIVSNNINVLNIKNIDNFIYSDHTPIIIDIEVNNVEK